MFVMGITDINYDEFVVNLLDLLLAQRLYSSPKQWLLESVRDQPETTA